MKVGALFGWSIVIYAVMFLIWSGFIAYGFVGGSAPRVASFIILVALALIAGRALGFSRWQDILPYSVTWGFLMAFLDVIFTVPITGWAVFTDWNVWFGYTLVALVPLLAPWTKRYSLGV